MVREPRTIARYAFTLLHLQIFILQHKNIFDPYIEKQRKTLAFSLQIMVKSLMSTNRRIKMTQKKLTEIATEWEKRENLVDSHEFYNKYKPVYNHITNKDFKEGQTEGDEIGVAQYFETYGEEWEYVKKQPNNKIWTFINCDGEDYITQGYHLVNRLNYLIASVPFKEGDKEDFIDWVDFIQCERCGSHGETKEEILTGFKHYKDEGLCSRKFLDHDLLCIDCLKENEDE